MVSKAVLFAPEDAYRCGGPSCTRSGARSVRLAVLPVGNKPLVQHALESLVEAGIRDLTVISAPHVADEVRAIVASAASDRVTAQVLTHVGTFVDALDEIAPYVGAEPFLVHLGDSLTRSELAPAIAGACPNDNDVMALVEETSGEATPLAAKLASVPTAGIYVFGPGVLALRDEPGGPADWELEIAAATERLEAAGGSVELRSVSDWWRFRPRPDAILQANRFFLSGLRDATGGAWLESCDLEGPVEADPTVRLTSTTVRGPVIIGPRAEIRDSYIGPYTSIAADVRIENAEVENSVVLEGASIQHLGGRLEASVVGPRARIFRDFRLPRAVRVKIGEDAEIAIT
jgi:glucose-1-phosphate thymidylyltransferase